MSLKEHLPRTQEKLEGACLDHHCERSLNLCDSSSTQLSLFLLTGEAGIVNIQGCGMYWYLGWLARLRTLTQTQASSPILLKVCRNFKESQHFDLLIEMSWKSDISLNFIFLKHKVFQKTFLLNSGLNFSLNLAFNHKNLFPAVCYLQWENVC